MCKYDIQKYIVYDLYGLLIVIGKTLCFMCGLVENRVSGVNIVGYGLYGIELFIFLVYVMNKNLF